MTKKELIEKMAADARITKAAAGRSLDSFIKSVKRTLQQDKRFTLAGFGTFSVSKRKERKGRNPKTGETIMIPARRAPKFTAGKGLKNAVR